MHFNLVNEPSLPAVVWFCVAVMARAFPEYIADRKDLFLVQSIASYFLLACGVVYVVSVRSMNIINYLVK